MKVYISRHWDTGDYYSSTETFIGVFDSYERAVAAIEAVKKIPCPHRKNQSAYYGDLSLRGAADRSMYFFDIEEYEINRVVVEAS